MSFDPDFIDAPLPPELPAAEAHRRFVDELDWHLSEMETLRAQLERVRREADLRVETEVAAVRARHAADIAGALETQRASLEEALRRSVGAEVEARLREDFLERLKASHEAREKAAESDRAFLKERFDADLAQAMADAQRRLDREADAKARDHYEKRRVEDREAEAALHAKTIADLTREREALKERLGKEAEAARATVESANRAYAESKTKYVESAVADLQAAHAKEMETLHKELEALDKRHVEAAARELAELKKTHERENALLGTQKDLEAAQARRSLEAEHAKVQEDMRKRVQDEAQKELQIRTDRMKAEWDKLRVRFDEELNKIRAEMKRREQIWEDKVKAAESESAAQMVEMRAKLGNIEDAAARLEREKAAATAEAGALRLERDKDSAALAGLKVSSDDAVKKLSDDLQKVSADKAALEAKLADTKKELEAKLKAVDVQLREERKKNVEWETRLKELENRGVWQRLRGK